MAEKIHLTKEYERDVSMIIEGVWGRSLSNLVKNRLHRELPYKVMCAFYATEENVQIWENKKGIQWLKNTLLEENNKGLEFITKVTTEYLELLHQLEQFWAEGPTDDEKKVKRYLDLMFVTMELFSLWYYSVSNEETPQNVQDILIPMRNKDECFARNALYVKGCIEKLGGDPRLANLILPDEFPGLPSTEVLKMRANGTLIIGDETYFGKLEDYAKTHPEYEFEGLFDVLEKTTLIKGQPAHKGIVKGKVRVVKNQFQMEQVEEGDIMVAPMTTPDFLPAMKKAAAFVTDEGGITCHAAIVAREMKKPCVIGTKIATKILKNGDTVEVDAEKGIITILK